MLTLSWFLIKNSHFLLKKTAKKSKKQPKINFFDEFLRKNTNISSFLRFLKKIIRV